MHRYYPRMSAEQAAERDVVAAADRVDYIQLVHNALATEMAHAQTRQACYADTARMDAPSFEPGNWVLLQRRNVKTRRPSDKLDSKLLGPFKVLESISRHAVRLDLPSTIKIHPVFHTSLLELYCSNEVQPLIEPPQPDIVDGREEWEVKAILQSRPGTLRKMRNRRRS